MLKTEPEDFRVTEVPLYEPAGDGPHLYFWIEKRGRTTEDVVQALRRAGAEQVGVAGQKDRHAITRQWISLLDTGREAAENALKELDGVDVLDAGLHGNKLRMGHLRGNRFDIRVRNVEPDEGRVEAITASITREGLVNIFGAQRFGRHGDNAEKGRAALSGKLRGPKHKVQFFVSALQSELFNRYAERRFEQGTIRRVISGDVLKKVDSGGLFQSENIDEEQARLEAREIVPAGPLFGAKMPEAAADAAALEDAILAAAELTRDDFSRASRLTAGSRRSLIVYPEDLTARLTLSPDSGQAEADLHLSFFLPKGSFATTLIQEYTGGLP